MAFSSMSIGGMSSGMDTENIIKQLLQLERAPIVKFQQQQLTLRKVDEAWGGVTTKLSSLRSAVDDLRKPGSLDGLFKVLSSREDTVAATVTGTPKAGSINFSVEQLAQNHQVALNAGANTADQLTSPDDLVGNGTLRFRQGTGTWTEIVTDGKTLAEVTDEINAVAGIDAQMVKRSDNDYQLVVAARNSGLSNEIEFDFASAPPSLANADELQAALDAHLKMGTMDVYRSSNTIDDLVDGVTLDLKQAQPGTSVTITTERDQDAAIDKVKKLVDAVNGVLTKLGELTAYDPESKKAGALQGDSTARKLANDLRTQLSDVVAGLTGDHRTAGSVGISLTRDGKVELDETKLRAALDADPGAVADLFSESANAKGIAGTLHSGVLLWAEGDKKSSNEYVARGSIGRARDSATTTIKRFDDRIADFERRIDNREVTLRKQFTAMETALGQLQSQGAWLQSQLGSLNAGQM